MYIAVKYSLLKLLFGGGAVPLCQVIECNVDFVYANPKANKKLISPSDSTFFS